LLSQDYFPSSTPIPYTCNMIWYDMRMRVGLKNADQITGCNDSSSLVSNQVWSQNTTVQIYFKNIFIFCLGSYFWRKKSKSQETVPESTGEDREVALLRRWYTCLKIDVGVRGVGISLELREWIRVDYITYCKLNLSFISFNKIYFVINN
jgi:hypothetical protein